MNTRIAAALTCLLTAPAAVHAQTAGNGFLFGRPSAVFSIRGGFASPTANSDVFSFAAKQLTLGKGDFGSGTVVTDLGVRVADRVDVQFGFSFSDRNINSEFRDWVDNNNLPIEQQTGFRRTAVTLGAKYYLTSPGRSISRLAWVPAKVTPYVSAGVGAMGYRFRQEGDFVDFQTLDVFPTKLSSKGWSPMAYAAGGVDYSLTTRLGLISEARYDRSRATMSSVFEGFDRIDLSGLSASVGLSLRF